MKTYRATSGILCAIIILLSFTSCIPPWVWHYTTEDGVFKTLDSSLIVDLQYKTALFLTEEQDLELDVGVTSGLRQMDFINHIPYDGQIHGITEDMILLYVDVKADKKAKTLTLTVTGGSLEQFLGNVYVLDFYPGEELKFDDPVETREGADNSGKIEG